MQTITFEVVGMSPLLMSSPKAMVRTNDKPGMKKIPTSEDEAEAQAYRLPDGNLYMPTAAFHSAILAACAGRRIGKRGAKAVMSGAVFVTDECMPVIDPKNDKPLREYKIDVRRCVIQQKSIMRARPRLEEWAGKISFEIDTDFVKPDWVEEILQVAGKTIGVGNYRPEKKGPFGRFTAKLVTEESTEKPRKKAA